MRQKLLHNFQNVIALCVSVIVICHNGFLELEIKARFIKRWYMEKTLVIAMHPEGKKKKDHKTPKNCDNFSVSFWR